MIAHVIGPRGRMEYLALHLDPMQAREVWVPVRQACEVSELEAIKVCVRDVQTQMEPLVWEAKRLRGLCDIRGREPSDREQERMRELGGSVFGSIARTGRNVARLIDWLNTWDEVDLDAEFMRGKVVERVRPGPGHKVERFQLALKRVAMRRGHDLDTAKELLFRPETLEHLLGDVADELKGAGLTPDEINALINVLRERKSVLALGMGLFGHTMASEPGKGSQSTPASEPDREEP